MPVNPSTEQILSNLSIASLNPMQIAVGEAISSKADLLLLSPTGSGKTLAFLLPVLQLLKQEPGVQCMVLTPSRELAIQIEQVWKKMATGWKISCCYGGHDMQTEIQNLAEPPAILVGTPGRIADHIKRATFDTKALNTLVLDEFDKSLALGFEEEMIYIIGSLKQVRQRIFVSATQAVAVPDFAGAEELKILDFTGAADQTDKLELKLVLSDEKDKLGKLFDLLCHINNEPALIFCNHRDAVERTSDLLKERGVENIAFHGGMEQMQREQALIQFRNGSMQFLVATDLAARGLDIPEMKHVIHYHLPATEAEFTHRNGRTARMNDNGTAYILWHVDEPLPYYIKEKPATLNIRPAAKPPASPEWVTIYINGGKKDKLNKIDIVGFLSKKGELEKEDIGLIIVKDRNSFVAVKKKTLKKLLPLVQQEKIKGTKYKIVVAR